MASSKPALREALAFTADDLAANQNGTLSDRQRAYLRIDRQKNMILGGVLITALIFVVTGLLFVGVDTQNRILQILGVILLCCNVGLSWFFGVNWIRMTYDLRTGAVEAVEGAAQHVVRELGRAKAGSVRIGDQVEIPTEEVEIFAAFEPGARYRLYRTSHTGRLLSVEKA